jgi:hypothetical protein
MTNELEALADHMRILAGPDGSKEAWREMQAYLLRGADAIDGLLAERDAVIYEAAELLGESEGLVRVSGTPPPEEQT